MRGKRKKVNAASRGPRAFDPEEAAAVHLTLKAYLITRRLRAARLPQGESVLEAGHINEFLDYLRWLERKE